MPSALIFDAYGTLFDIASVSEACAAVTDDPARLVAVWRAKQLAYSFLRALMGPAAYVDFWQITRDALEFAADQVGVRLSSADRDRVLEGWLNIRPYPEVASALERLTESGQTCTILSNGSPRMLHAALASSGLTDRFHAVLSVDAVHTYKPDPRVYQLALDTLGVPADGVLFVSSNGWDAAGAKAFGLPVAWLNRAGAPPERLGFPPDFIASDLTGLVNQLP